MIKSSKPYGVVLAGGQSRRMGGRDKALQTIQGKSLVELVCLRLRPQVGSLLINTNADARNFAHLGCPVKADVAPGWLGPLAGLLTGLEWARDQGGAESWLVSVAVDAPFLPGDLVSRLGDAVCDHGAVAAIASSGGRMHPVFGLWSVALTDDLRRAVCERDMRRMMDWVDRVGAVSVDWPTGGGDPFTNLNTPDQLTLVSKSQLS